ncbi:hypothetical protein A2U01_0115340, partial [Trifolium medium]|nr:hypothetical protein [Trifolium medium]
DEEYMSGVLHNALSNLQHVCLLLRLNALYEDSLHIGL